MKHLLSALATLSLFVAGNALADTYEVDAAHAYALFGISHLGITTNYGRFDKLGGSINWDDADPAKISVTLEIDTASVSTAVAKRDDHLRGPDFFNVKQFPKMTFKSKKVAKAGDKTYAVTGDLTLLGATKEITINVDMTGEGKDPWGNFRKGWHTEFKINRQDFGVKHMTGALGDEVKVILAVEGIKKG